MDTTSRPRTDSSRYRVRVIESERGWGSKVDSIEYFDTEAEAWAFEKSFNADNPPAVNGIAPDWYMQAQDPEALPARAAINKALGGTEP